MSDREFKSVIFLERITVKLREYVLKELSNAVLP